MSLNKVMLIGRLEDKPQSREIDGGRKIIGLSIVTTQHGLDPETGEAQAGREWHRIVIIDKDLATFAEAHLAKDDQVYVEGQLHTECWQDETYQWRSLTKILLWQQGDRLRRLVPGDDTPPMVGPRDPVLAAAREAHLIEHSSPDAWLGKTASSHTD